MFRFCFRRPRHGVYSFVFVGSSPNGSKRAGFIVCLPLTVCLVVIVGEVLCMVTVNACGENLRYGLVYLPIILLFLRNSTKGLREGGADVYNCRFSFGKLWERVPLSSN